MKIRGAVIDRAFRISWRGDISTDIWEGLGEGGVDLARDRDGDFDLDFFGVGGQGFLRALRAEATIFGGKVGVGGWVGVG